MPSLAMALTAHPILPDDTDDDTATDHLQEDLVEEEYPISDIDPLEREHLAHEQAISEFLSPLSLDDATLHQLAHRFAGVYTELARYSDEQFLPTPVTKLPNGQETGRYLAVDLGGSNLRVSFIELLGDAACDSPPTRSPDALQGSRDTILSPQRDRIKRTLEKAWPIGEHLKKDNADDLFSWIGDCVAEVVADSLTCDDTKSQIPEVLDMGMTFSFPIMQDSLAEATMMQTGKGFAMTSSSDLNLRNILLRGYEKHTRRPDDSQEPSSKRRKLFALPKLNIVAMTNDTVATLASLAYSVKSLPNSRVAMAIIVGTGCNATIPMQLGDLHESKANHVISKNPGARETVVNTEWTMAGAVAPLKELNIVTKWDAALDSACARPGFQPFEYMTGGRYIGELIRLILFEYLTSLVQLSKRDLPGNLIQEYALTTAYISENVARARSDETLAHELNRSLPPPESSEWSWEPRTAGAFRKIAMTVQKRSAGLIAAAVVGLLACAREIELKREDSNDNTPLFSHSESPYPVSHHQLNPEKSSSSSPTAPKTSNINSKNGSDATTATTTTTSSISHGPIVPILTPAHAGWQSGPEELVVAYTGGIIQNYPKFKEMCQEHIDRLIMRTGPQKGGKSVFLREASNGGVIGAGVLAGMVVNH